MGIYGLMGVNGDFHIRSECYKGHRVASRGLGPKSATHSFIFHYARPSK